MRVVRTIVAVLFAATIAVTGCTAHTTADQPAPLPPAPNPTHAPGPPTPRTDPNDPTRVDRQALIYTAVLRHYLTSGDHHSGTTGSQRSSCLTTRWPVPAPKATKCPEAGRSRPPPGVRSPTASPMLGR